MQSEAVSTTAVRLIGAALASSDSPASQVVLGDALQLLTSVLTASSHLTPDLQVRSSCPAVSVEAVAAFA